MTENRSIIDLRKNVGVWISVVLAIAAFTSGIYQYSHNKKQEFRKVFWEKQYSLYSEVTKLAAQIAIADDLKDVAQKEDDFANCVGDQCRWWEQGSIRCYGFINDGTLQNSATFTAGKVGQAFSFDGMEDHVVIGNPIRIWVWSVKRESQMLKRRWRVRRGRPRN